LEDLQRTGPIFRRLLQVWPAPSSSSSSSLRRRRRRRNHSATVN